MAIYYRVVFRRNFLLPIKRSIFQIKGKKRFRCRKNNIIFINLHRETGEILWSTNILKVLKKKKRSTQISGYIIGSGKIYSTTLNGYLIVSSAVTGEVEYFKKISDEITSSPIISDGSMYILTEESRLLGFK